MRKLRHPSRSRRLIAISQHPCLSELAQEAKKRGYIQCPEDYPFSSISSSFDRLCLDLLDMVDPNPKTAFSEEAQELLLSRKIEDLDLSVRSYNCLKRENINRIGDIVELSYSQLLAIRNLGCRCCDEVVRKISELGLSLNDEN